MGRGTSKAGKGGGGGGNSVSFNDFDEYYKNRLNSIASEVHQKQIVAGLINSDSKAVRLKAKNAIRRINVLDKQYEEITRSAIADVKQRRKLIGRSR